MTRFIDDAIEQIKNNSIEELDLSGNKIGSIGGSAIGDMLMVNSILTKLNLSDCSIGHYATVKIGEALKSNTTLLDLNLCNNLIRADSISGVCHIVCVSCKRI
jgi:Ran GTPase-activating protein (RanGAP) involved in mRNA processing and transport